MPKGFGEANPPRIWLQSVHFDGSEKFVRYDGRDRNLQKRAIALLKDQAVEFVVVLRGSADIGNDIKQVDVLADYQREARSGAVRVQ